MKILKDLFQIVTYADIGHMKLFRYQGKWWSKLHGGYGCECSPHGTPLNGPSGHNIRSFDKTLKVGINVIGKS